MFENGLDVSEIKRGNGNYLSDIVIFFKDTGIKSTLTDAGKGR